MIRDCPYRLDLLKEGESIQLAFLADEPSQEKVDLLRNYEGDPDECFIKGKEVYLFLRQSILDSKLAAQLPKLGVQTTVRNWKTVIKLSTMVEVL
jgi:uncharacterized protein (DUF1697 family)